MIPSGAVRTFIINADADRLCPSGELFAGELAVAGVDVSVGREIGSRHGFLNTVGDPAGERTLARIRDIVREAHAFGDAAKRS